MLNQSVINDPLPKYGFRAQSEIGKADSGRISGVVVVLTLNGQVPFLQEPGAELLLAAFSGSLWAQSETPLTSARDQGHLHGIETGGNEAFSLPVVSTLAAKNLPRRHI